MIPQKEIDEFLVRFAGAMTGALEDAGLEGYWKATNATGFPYISINENLPPVDDLLVGGLAIPPWVIGALMEEDGKKRGDVKAREMGKNLEMFGEGDIIYALNMLIHHTIPRLARPQWWSPQARVTTSRGYSPAPEQRTDVSHKVIKL